VNICLLQQWEFRRYRLSRIAPQCCDHPHLSFAKALDALARGLYDITHVAGYEVLIPVGLFTLAYRPSGGVPVLQRVPGPPPSHVQEAR